MKLLSRNFKFALVALVASAVMGGAQSSWAQKCDPDLFSALNQLTENARKKTEEKIAKYLDGAIPMQEKKVQQHASNANRLQEEAATIQKKIDDLKKSQAVTIGQPPKELEAAITQKQQELALTTKALNEQLRLAEEARNWIAGAKSHVNTIAEAHNNFRNSLALTALNSPNLSDPGVKRAVCDLTEEFNSLINNHTPTKEWEKYNYFNSRVTGADVKIEQLVAKLPWWQRYLPGTHEKLTNARYALQSWADKGKVGTGRLGQVCSMALALAGVVGNFFSGSTAEACEPTKPNPLAPTATPTVSGSPSPGAGSGNGDSFDNTGGSSNASPEADLPACPICPSPNPEPTVTVAAVPSPIGTRAATQRSR